MSEIASRVKEIIVDKLAVDENEVLPKLLSPLTSVLTASTP